MDQGNGTPATYAECYQWFVAPTDLNNANPDTSKAPDVINNSWGCPPSEGCVDPNVLLTVVDNLRAAGIVTVHSAGNSGSVCSSVTDPAAIYASSLSVGATDINDNIASFSSRGPVTVDGSNRLKPNVSAPGVNVRSSLPGTGYGSLSGTSMAGPHVVGVVALIMSAYPALNGDPTGVQNLLQGSAVPRTTTQICGGVPGSSIPNNTYGYGRVDALNAYNANQPALAVHVGDLDARKKDKAAQWGVEITVLVRGSAAQLISGAVVNFMVDGSTAKTCTTGAAGTCAARIFLPDSQASTSWVVTSITKSGTTYDALANTDPDPDSNGTTIVVNQP
jgi:subtilisin family serine protease